MVEGETIMRKIITFITSILFLTGCFITNDDQEGSIKKSEAVFFIRDVSLKEKSKLDLQWSFIDLRSNEIVMSIDLSELGYQTGEGLDENKVIKLVNELATEINQPLVNPTITRVGEIIAGKTKVSLAEEDLIDQMLSLAYYNKSIFLPIYEEEPSVTTADLKSIKNVQISSYVTSFNPNVAGRSQNINLSSQSIDHYVIGPNEIFSFNEVVGPRTKENGYQEAKEIVNHQFVIGIGGGICQTSSTLFNAIDLAGLEVVERYSHSREIGYVPKNRDATVSWGGPDFKFRNPYEFPLLISATTNLQTGKIEVNVYGSYKPDKLMVSAP